MDVDDPDWPVYEAPTLYERLSLVLVGFAGYARRFAARLTEPIPGTGPVPSMEHAAYYRLERAARWAIALADVISGKTRILPRPATAGPLIARTAAAAPSASGAARRLSRRFSGRHTFCDGDYRSMREAFATRSIGELTVRICRELNINPGAAQWPAELVAIVQTPAAWSAEHFPPPPPDPPLPDPPVRRPTPVPRLTFSRTADLPHDQTGQPPEPPVTPPPWPPP